MCSSRLMDLECAFEHAVRRPPYMKGSARPLVGVCGAMVKLCHDPGGGGRLSIKGVSGD